MTVFSLAALPIQSTDVLAVVYPLAAALVAALLLPRLGIVRRSRRRIAWTAASAGLGALAGTLAIWQAVDVHDLFGAPASSVIRAAAAAAGAAIGLAVSNLIGTRWWRKSLAVVAATAAIASAGLMINRDVAYFPTLGDVVGDTGVTALHVSRAADATADRMPAHGRIGTVRIPATVSHFHARDAWVYLPPAALVGERNLPVVIAMAGQPGSPSDVFLAGRLQTALDRIAADHHGVAPVVVVPDQLGGYNVNPMCVDSAMGHVATYITDDVRGWILANLPVSPARAMWSVAGFSEGATCAVQFGVRYPQLFGSFIAVSPEVGPINGSVARSVRDAFGGSLARYEAAQPRAIMRAHGRYTQTTAFYAVGADDRRYGADAGILAAASERAGIRSTLVVLPQLAHNWNTGAAGLGLGLTALLPVWGIDR